jgi:hypothetical protein
VSWALQQREDDWTLKEFAEKVYYDRYLLNWVLKTMKENPGHRADVVVETAKETPSHRADVIELFLRYTTCVGPALGRALLNVDNPRYIVLLLMRIETLLSPESWGLWPNQAPRGEVWDKESGKWALSRQQVWKPVATETIRKRIEDDQSHHKHLFPEGFGRTQVEQALYDAANSLRQVLEQIVPADQHLTPPDDFKPAMTALEMAFEAALPHDLVRACDYTAQKKWGWQPVTLPDGVLAPDLMKAADEHARYLCSDADPFKRPVGQRVLGFKMRDWVAAGALLFDKETQQEILKEWPFTFDGQQKDPPKSFNELTGSRGLARGCERGGLGSDGLKLWMETYEARGDFDG